MFLRNSNAPCDLWDRVTFLDVLFHLRIITSSLFFRLPFSPPSDVGIDALTNRLLGRSLSDFCQIGTRVTIGVLAVAVHGLG